MTSKVEPRRPRVFEVDDPSLVTSREPELNTAPPDAAAEGLSPAPADAFKTGRRKSFSWGGLLASAIFGLASIAIGLWFTHAVSEVLTHNDPIGWIAWVLVGLLVLSALVITVRETAGLLRLSRLDGLRRDIDAALLQRNPATERRAVDRLVAISANRPSLKWNVARLKEHLHDVRDPGDLLRLTERELVAPLDGEARRMILQSAKRITTVTAISPMPFIAMLYVMVENLRLLRTLAGLYGGRPGLLGGLRLARMVLVHIVATGGIALTDDLLGQFLGQDLLRRLSRRLGEGVFNGALTARIGVAAIEVIRPMPFIETGPIRVRDLVSELFRSRGATGAPAQRGAAP